VGWAALITCALPSCHHASHLGPLSHSIIQLHVIQVPFTSPFYQALMLVYDLPTINLDGVLNAPTIYSHFPVPSRRVSRYFFFFLLKYFALRSITHLHTRSSVIVGFPSRRFLLHLERAFHTGLRMAIRSQEVRSIGFPSAALDLRVMYDSVANDFCRKPVEHQGIRLL